MIYDKLCHLTRYRGISASLDCAIDFLLTADLSALASGRVDIDGDAVYGNHFSYTTAPYSQASLFENHQKYLDLHVVLRGCEDLAVAPVETLQQVEVLESEDSVLYTGHPDCMLPGEPGRFVVLFPEEAHMPKLARGAPSDVDKLVLKIAL